MSLTEHIHRETGLDDLDAKMAELVLFYGGFEGDRLKLLRHERDDVRVLVEKMNRSRSERDFKTSDYLRDVLVRCGLERLARNTTAL